MDVIGMPISASSSAALGDRGDHVDAKPVLLLLLLLVEAPLEQEARGQYPARPSTGHFDGGAGLSAGLSARS